MDRNIIGHQIVDASGYNIHGDENDPFNLHSFEILTGIAVDQAKKWAEKNEGYSVIPVYEGDVEEPNMVEDLALPV